MEPHHNGAQVLVLIAQQLDFFAHALQHGLAWIHLKAGFVDYALGSCSVHQRVERFVTKAEAGRDTCHHQAQRRASYCVHEQLC